MRDYIVKNRYLLPLIFILDLAINYASALGFILSNTQKEISDQYVNFIAPASFTFSIWAVIYLGILYLLILDFFAKEDTSFISTYRAQIKPLFFEMLIYNFLWIILWSENKILISLIVIAAYARNLIRIMKIISQNKVLRSHLFLKLSVGLHAGWLVFATVANFVTYLVSIGIDATNGLAVLWSIGLLIIGIGALAYFYAQYGNQAVMLPGIWVLIGLYAKHNDSNFVNANQTIKFAVIVLLILSLTAYFYFYYLQQKQQEKSRV